MRFVTSDGEPYIMNLFHSRTQCPHVTMLPPHFQLRPFFMLGVTPPKTLPTAGSPWRNMADPSGDLQVVDGAVQRIRMEILPAKDARIVSR